MQKLPLALIGAVSLFTLPALAQSSGSTNNSSGQTTTEGGINNAQRQSTQQIRQKLMQNLAKDGFTNVRIVPDSFLVHATNKQGEHVVMIINPDSVFSVTQVPNRQANSGSPNGSSGNQQGLGGNPSSSNPTTKQ